MESIKKKLIDIMEDLNIEVQDDGTFSAESFQVIQLIVELEEKFGIQFPIESLQFDKLNSVDFFYDIITDLYTR